MNRIQKKLTPYQKLEQELRKSADESPSTRSRPRIVDKMEDDRSYRKNRKSGLVGAALPGDEPTDDDLAPETLIHEDGARSPFEEGDDIPMDQTYRIVGGNQIGAGRGFDEAELAQIDPLDGKN